MALILGVDRFMSECRALTNFIGNAVATIVVARWEGELDEERLAAVLDGDVETDEEGMPVRASPPDPRHPPPPPKGPHRGPFARQSSVAAPRSR